MKILLLLTAAALSSTAIAQVTLFSDNFNRDDDPNLSASTVGMSGTVAPITYLEPVDVCGHCR